MIVRKIRLQRGWSQEHLSQLSGLSVRTIQRIERGQKAGLESLNALAAVFEISITELQVESDMNNKQQTAFEETQIIEHVKEIKGFYTHLITYACVITLLFIINLLTEPSYIWAWWPAMGWGMGIVSHGLSTFEILNFFGADWEKRQIEKRLGRKL